MPADAYAFDEWYEDHWAFFNRGLEDLERLLEHFVADWTEEYGFRLERPLVVRLKSRSRLLEKCTRKGIIDDFALLLRQPFPVSDIIGGRFVTRSLDDVHRLAQAIEENMNVGGLNHEDMVNSPSETGYRAHHFDGSIEVELRGVTNVVPVELQLKTLAADAWGYYTHDEAYSWTANNEDARFRRVRMFHRIIADQLHAVDELVSVVEELSRDAAYEISEGSTEGVFDLARVLNLVYSEYEYLLQVAEAQELLEMAVAKGVDSDGSLAELINPNSSFVASAAESFRITQKRAPRVPELLKAVLDSVPTGGSVDAGLAEEE